MSKVGEWLMSINEVDREDVPCVTHSTLKERCTDILFNNGFSKEQAEELAKSTIKQYGGGAPSACKDMIP